VFDIEKCLDDQLRDFTGSPLPTLILPEALDPRVIEAASGLIQYAKVVLPAAREEVERVIDGHGVPLRVARQRFLRSVSFVPPGAHPALCDEFAATLADRSRGRSWEVDPGTARRLAEEPIHFSILAVRLGYADAVLGGLVHSSHDFFRPCLRILERDGTVYEMSLFALPDSHEAGFFTENLVMFADVALNPVPDAERLADIAVGACLTMRNLIPAEVLPEVNGAILSYSTRGSGQGPSVDRIRQAEPLIQERLARLAAGNPAWRGIHIATELQVSCAISRQAARTKLGPAADDNPAIGKSNVLIAPTLDTGNLLHHIYATRFPEARSVLVIGGLKNQALDFSRGSSAADLILGAKALLLRLHRSGRYTVTPRDLFHPRFPVLAINPTNAETEVGLWRGRALVARERLAHAALPAAPPDQREVRRAAVLEFLGRHGFQPAELAAIVGRGGLLLPVESGVLRVDDGMVAHLLEGRCGHHVANLGAVLARDVGGPDHPNVFIVDPAVVDELDETARITGWAGSQQEAAWHALVQKSAAKRYALEHGREYEDLNLIVAHLGLGTSVGAHRQGRCVKVRNSLFDGPMALERAGTLPGMDLIELCFSGRSREDVVAELTQRGGVFSYLGTKDAAELERLVGAGDASAALVLEALAEQTAAEIAALVPKFLGRPVDQVILTGVLAESKRLVARLRELLSALPLELTIFPGDLELVSLRDGALHALRGIEPIRDYLPLRDRL
jgi:butyrate kinase